MHGLGHPAKLTTLEVGARLAQQLISTAHVLDIAAPFLDRGQRVEIDRIAVVGPHVVGIDRIDVVCDRAVIAAGMPALRQRIGQHQFGGDLAGREPVIHEAHGLIVQIAVHIALIGHELGRARLPPHRPVMLGIDHIDMRQVFSQRLIKILAPRQRIAGLGTADGAQVVHQLTGVFGQVQHTQRREKKMHLGWCLGARRELKDDLDAIDHMTLARLRDQDGRLDQRHAPGTGDFAKPTVDIAARAGRQGPAELKSRTPHHRHAGED